MDFVEFVAFFVIVKCKFLGNFMAFCIYEMRIIRPYECSEAIHNARCAFFWCEFTLKMLPCRINDKNLKQ